MPNLHAFFQTKEQQMRFFTIKHNRLIAYLCIFVYVSSLFSCAGFGFTFTGANLDPAIKNFNVETFYNEAMDGPANLNIQFTETLKTYYQRNTPLKIIESNGDLGFSGKITRYEVTPEASGGGELQNAQLQRLTIAVNVDFVNNYDDSKSFVKDFSFFEKFNAEENLSDVEDKLIKKIFEQIILDIFNATVADW